MQERTFTANKKLNLSLPQRVILVLIFLTGFGIRIYDLKEPPLDFHPVRQLRSALIARGVYYQLDKDLDPALREKAVEMATLEDYEPPIFEQIVGFTYYVLGAEKLWVSRIYLAVFCHWGAGSCIYWLAALHLFMRLLSVWQYIFIYPFQ